MDEKWMRVSFGVIQGYSGLFRVTRESERARKMIG
jgi:hypothetical protein